MYKQNRIPVLITAVICICIVNSVYAVEGPLMVDTGALHRYAGGWESTVDIYPSFWSPDGEKRSETMDTEWVLEDQFLSMVVKSGEDESWEMLKYDPCYHMYQRWIFDIDGTTEHWVGIWDEKTTSMSWKIDLGVMKGEMTDCFISDTIYTSKVIITDHGGNLLLDRRARYTRVQE